MKAYRRKAGVRYQLPKLSAEKRDVVISAIVSTASQRKVVEEFGIEKIYNRGFDTSRERRTLNEQDLNSNLASNLYQVLENKSDKITVNWNLNISNRYTVEELGKIKGVETVILSPELSFERIKK